MEYINNITETVEGYEVKNLKWNTVDNIIVGMVKCPIMGRAELHDGFIIVQWRKNGCATNRFKGREDLKLNISYK